MRLIYAGEESPNAHDGFVDRTCICLPGGRLRSIDSPVVTDTSLSLEVQPMSIWNSYISRARPPSNSYAGKVQFGGAMNWSAPSSLPARDLAPAPADSGAPSGVPQAGAVIFEIGLLLGIHLAVALAVTLILQVSGVA
jgi:hypothetical protein